MTIHDRKWRRRELVTAGLGLLLTAGGRQALATSAAALDPDQGVTAPEDLMKEHGVLDRCLLVYEEGLRRMDAKEEVSADVFRATADLIRRFVEEYHEKNEETYVFPVLQRAGKLTGLVDVLLEQHRAGRVVTRRILELARPDSFRWARSRAALGESCRAFIHMYRPHEAREDTVLFPALRTILSPERVEALGERMEKQEEKILGHGGFERSVAEVHDIEKKLAIDDLARFTPR